MSHDTLAKEQHVIEDMSAGVSGSSMFISPRMKVEEEFKVPKSVRTQSFREEPPNNNLSKYPSQQSATNAANQDIMMKEDFN